MKKLGTFAIFFSKISVFSFALNLAFGNVAISAPAPLRLEPGKISPPLRSGAVTGGQAADQFSLLGIRSEAKSGAERLVILYGDATGKPFKGEPGYFHISVDRSGKRLTIDLAQVTRTAVDPDQLKRILSSSRLIASSEMAMDPHDGSTNIVLHLKKSVRIQLLTPTPGSQANLAIEMRESAEEKR